MVDKWNYHGHQLPAAIKGCAKWLRDWDRGLEVPSVRITAGGPTGEQVAQCLVAAMVRRLNNRIPRVEAAFVAQADYLMIGIRAQGFDLSDSALGGAINWTYWLLRDGPDEAIKQFPPISRITVSNRWPQEPTVTGGRSCEQRDPVDRPAGLDGISRGCFLLPMAAVPDPVQQAAGELQKGKAGA